MNADERISALKKAYAEIILNTAQESAERILLSERKAQRFENELKVAKEESLRLLLRLKQMMDSKVRDAEFTSNTQLKKIEELEAQLQEGEDIVRDLREELGDVQSELERVTSDKAQQFDDHDIATHHKNQFFGFQPPQSRAEPLVGCAMNHACNSYCSLEFPSIILRSKGPELYRNGFTQRIRACDRNIMDQPSSVPVPEDEKRVREDEGGKVIRRANRHKRKRNVKKKIRQEEKSFPDWCSYTTKQRSMGYRKKRTPDSMNILLSSLRTHPISARDGVSFVESPSKISSRVLLVKDEPSLDQSTIKDTGGVLTAKTPLRKVGSEASEISNGIPSRASNDRRFMYTFQRKRKREALIKSEENESSKIISSEENASVGKSGSNENASLEKNTPQENASLEKSSLDDITSEENNTPSQLLQVAHQLISLSEGKWWQ